MNRGSWTEIWGETDPIERLEHELALLAGRYSQLRTDERVTLTDPSYPKQSETFPIQLLTDEVSGKVWKYGLNEITNGIYALIYRPLDNPK